MILFVTSFLTYIFIVPYECLVHNEFKKNREMREIRKGTQRISKEKEKDDSAT